MIDSATGQRIVVKQHSVYGSYIHVLSDEDSYALEDLFDDEWYVPYWPGNPLVPGEHGGNEFYFGSAVCAEKLQVILDSSGATIPRDVAAEVATDSESGTRVLVRIDKMYGPYFEVPFSAEPLWLEEILQGRFYLPYWVSKRIVDGVSVALAYHFGLAADSRKLQGMLDEIDFGNR